MSRVDAIIHQQLAEPINLQCGSIITTFQKKCDMVSSARANRRAEVESEAAAVASYNQLQDSDIAEATFNAELQEMIAAHEAEDNPDWTYDSDYDGGYNSDMDQCGCHSAFGKDDDGEVVHAGLKCKYRGCF